MTLPRGFGRGWDRPETDDESPKRKCKLGNICERRRNQCKIHEWTYDHDEAWMALRIIGIMATIIGLVVFAIILDEQGNIPTRQNIDGFSCNQLAEYIADKKSEYGYAIHRYEWLCVNEQIKEFQG